MRTTIGVAAAAVLGLALAVPSTIVTAQSSAQGMPEKQPKMVEALEHLQAAEKSLEQASHDKGGHRAKALKLVKEAEAEVKAGMEFDDTHKTQNEKK